MRHFGLAALLLACASPAIAQDRAAAVPSGGPTALQLVQTCSKGASGAAITDPACTGYLAGFIGALRIAMTVSDDFPICLPENGVTNAQVIDDVSDYLDQHEGYLQRSARSVVFLVLTERYPCQSK